MPTGPGGLDANDIWIYGEDDSEALASDLLNLGMQSVSDKLEVILDEVDDAIAAIPAPAKNLLYNCAMQVAQRGTSSTGITTTGYYTADRWVSPVVGVGAWTQTVEADGPTGSGLTKSLKMECTTADTPTGSESVSVRQYLEGQDLQGLKKGTADAESVTLSFWVKSNVTGTYVAWLQDADNSRHIAASYTIASSGVWEKKTITFAGDTSGAFDNDNALSLLVTWWLSAGPDRTSGTLATSWESVVTANTAVGQTNLAASTSNYWQVTGVQLEVGTVANRFEHKPYGVELAECQRYYVRLNAESLNAHFGSGVGATTTDGIIDIRHAPLRDGASSVEYSSVRLSDVVASSPIISNITVQHKSDKVTTLQCATTGLTTYRYYALLAWNDLNAYVALSSEL